MTRPSIAPAALEALLAAAPARVRKRLEAGPSPLLEWARENDEALVNVGAQLVRLPMFVESRDQVSCDCLLSPRCLHVLAVVSELEIDTDVELDDGDHDHDASRAGTGTDARAGTGAGAGLERGGLGQTNAVKENRIESSAPVNGSSSANSQRPTTEVCELAEFAWNAGAEVLLAGASACLTSHRVQLLTVASQAKALRLPRLATAAIRVATGLWELRGNAPGFRAREFAGDLRELLFVAQALTSSAELEVVGRGRRDYTQLGSTTLHGIVCEPIVTASGYAGVVTYFLHPEQGVVTFGDVRPGSVSYTENVYRTGSRLGEMNAPPERTGRSKVFTSQLTVSAEGRIGSGKASSAAISGESGWNSDPLESLWKEQTAATQLSNSRSSSLESTPRERLIFADATILLGGQRGVALECDDGTSLTAIVHPELPATIAVLRRLASVAPARMRVVAVAASNHGNDVFLLAVGPIPGDAEVKLHFPDAMAGRFMVGLDQVGAGALAEISYAKAGDGAVTIEESATGEDLAVGEKLSSQALRNPPLEIGGSMTMARNVVNLVSMGGHHGVGGPARQRIVKLATWLRADGFTYGATLVENLHKIAGSKRRTITGESRPVAATDLAQAWLQAAVYIEGASMN